MKILKIILPLVVIAALIAGDWYYMGNFFHIERNSTTEIISSLQKTREIDKLYTGVYYIPIIDVEMGFLKRDIIKEGLIEGLKTQIPIYGLFKIYEQGKKFMNDQPVLDIDKNKEVIIGTCTKRYEVAVGYDHLLKMMEDRDFIAEICSGDFKNLPEPEILAVNSASVDVLGKYDSSGACFKWDSQPEVRKKLILTSIHEDGLLKQIMETGKTALKNIISPLCVTN